MQAALEYSIADSYLNDTSDANLQATLKLGMLEMIAGEFAGAAQAGRPERPEQFSVAGLAMGPSAKRASISSSRARRAWRRTSRARCR